MAILSLILLYGVFQFAFGAEPTVNCTAPRSPAHGQAFLYQDGRVVKYVCEPGYVLQGKEFVRCVDGKWEDELTTCVKIDGNDIAGDFLKEVPQPPVPPSRPLFNWGAEDDLTEEQEQNSTSDDDLPMSDEARLRMVLYPRHRARIVTTRIRPARIHGASELEEEEKKRSDSNKEKTSATTIHLEGPPSSIFVRRTVTPGKRESQEQTLNQQYRAAAVHMTVDNTEDADHVQVVALPRRAAVSQNDKGEEALRQMYWWAQQNYPRQSSLVEYRSGNPVVMTLSESQIAWINSLHPELRDQYLRDLYVVRAEEAVEGARAQAFLRRYEDAYNLYQAPYYYRQPVSIVTRDPMSLYDYSCNQAGSHFVTAPKLSNAHIARYDRRQNPNSPRNHYLTALYRCNTGYVMLDPRFTELHCSQRRWIGTEPICIPRA